RQSDGDQDADDQNDHHQLDEGEALVVLPALPEAFEHGVTSLSVCMRIPMTRISTLFRSSWKSPLPFSRGSRRNESNWVVIRIARQARRSYPRWSLALLQTPDRLLDEVDDVEHGHVQRDDR